MIWMLAGFTFFTGIPGRTKCPVSHESAMASLLLFLMIDVEYAVSNFYLFDC